MAELQFFFAMDEEKVKKYFSEIKKVAEQRHCKIDDKPREEETGCFKFIAYGTSVELKWLRSVLIDKDLPQGYLVE